ncbi:MAG: hypothetical protein QXI16_04275, partial [Sulfolobaceae archaeon]
MKFNKFLFALSSVVLIIITVALSIGATQLIQPDNVSIILTPNSTGINYFTISGINTTNFTFYQDNTTPNSNVTMNVTNYSVDNNNDTVVEIQTIVGNDINNEIVFGILNSFGINSWLQLFVDAQPPSIGSPILDNPFCGLNKNIIIPLTDAGLINVNSIQLTLDGNYYTPEYANNLLNFTTPYQPLCGNHTLVLNVSDVDGYNTKLLNGSPLSSTLTWNFTLTPLIPPNFTINTYNSITSNSTFLLTGWYNTTIPTDNITINGQNATLNNSQWNYTTTLNNGLNNFTIMASNPAGNETQYAVVNLDTIPPSIQT